MLSFWSPASAAVLSLASPPGGSLYRYARRMTPAAGRRSFHHNGLGRAGQASWLVGALELNLDAAARPAGARQGAPANKSQLVTGVRVRDIKVEVWCNPPKSAQF